MTNILVTGGAGFIGSHLVEALLMRGDTVRVLDNLSTGSLANLAPVARDVEFIQGDLRDPDIVARAVAGSELIFHQGALSSVPHSVQDPMTANEINVRGTLNLLLAARTAHVRRIVVASSASIYGDNPIVPKIETMAAEPRSPYALTKLATEQYACIFAQLYDLEAVALRYFNVFGPRQDPRSHYSGVIARFCTNALHGKPCLIYGDGLQSRDFVSVTDVVQANLLAATAPEANGQAFNIACGVQTNLLTIVDLLRALNNRSIEIVYKAPRSGDVRHSLADLTKSQTLLGYSPRVSFAEGLRQTFAWYQQDLM